MKRLYTVVQYDEMMARIRATVPDVAVSSDFIVGFCGETEASFQKSVELVLRSRFKNSFIFKYSPRPGTKADALYADDIPDDIKKRRNNELLAVQNGISVEQNRPFLGRTVEVLVEGLGREFGGVAPEEESGPVQLSGRTRCDRIVVFRGNERLIGQMIPVQVEEASAVTLFGRVVTTERTAVETGR
jgi:tRNA-2-methylthio-N6-dimethylallyladenosine synthase